LQSVNWQDSEITLSGQEVYPVTQAVNVMRIPDPLLKSVGFVSRYDPDQPLRYGGTAFITGVLMDKETGAGLAHLVTAKHVAEAIEPAETVVAFNAKDGAPRFLRTGDNHWFYHPTEAESVDVAVLPFGTVNFKEYDITWIPEDIFATDARISEFRLGLGDEIFTVGLFTRFFGSTHLIPLVRTGNISMMPRDKLPIEGFGEMEAYLAEARSIGGLSGSPVFARNTVDMPMQTAEGESAKMSGLGGRLHLLGLMHGHWDLPATFSSAEQAEAVNMGVAIVVPAKKILEVLYHPELVKMRKEHWESQKNGNTPTADSALQKPFTRQEFEAALKKVSRKVPPKK